MLLVQLENAFSDKNVAAIIANAILVLFFENRTTVRTSHRFAGVTRVGVVTKDESVNAPSFGRLQMPSSKYLVSHSDYTILLKHLGDYY
jgi:hypothetical protein